MKEDVLMKRILCILLGLSLLLGSVSFAYAEEDDVDYSDEELAGCRRDL